MDGGVHIASEGVGGSRLRLVYHLGIQDFFSPMQFLLSILLAYREPFPCREECGMELHWAVVDDRHRSFPDKGLARRIG